MASRLNGESARYIHVVRKRYFFIFLSFPFYPQRDQLRATSSRHVVPRFPLFATDFYHFYSIQQHSTSQSNHGHSTSLETYVLPSLTFQTTHSILSPAMTNHFSMVLFLSSLIFYTSPPYNLPLLLQLFTLQFINFHFKFINLISKFLFNSIRYQLIFNINFQFHRKKMHSFLLQLKISLCLMTKNVAPSTRFIYVAARNESLF